MKPLLTNKQTNKNPNKQECSNAKGRVTWGIKRNLVTKI